MGGFGSINMGLPTAPTPTIGLLTGSSLMAVVASELVAFPYFSLLTGTTGGDLERDLEYPRLRSPLRERRPYDRERRLRS